MSQTIACPHCGQTYTITAEQAPQYAGRSIQCTQCGQPFPVTLAGDPQSPPPPMAAPPIGTRPSNAPPGYPPPSVNYGGYAPALPASKLAITALVFGCIGVLFFPAGLIAIILGIIALVQMRDRRVGGKGLAIAGICVGAGGMVMSMCLISIMLPSLNRARETANRIKCASNMRQIGQAMLLYANENRGAYPPTADELLLTQDITTEVFTCPSSNDQKANQNAGTATMIAEFHKPGHDSYIYVGNGQTTAAPADAILLYEPLSDHSNDGSNILWGDGHVTFESKNEVNSLINELKTGHNPPRPSRMRGR